MSTYIEVKPRIRILRTRRNATREYICKDISLIQQFPQSNSAHMAQDTSETEKAKTSLYTIVMCKDKEVNLAKFTRAMILYKLYNKTGPPLK